jgi:hypothetical protein
MENVTLFSIFMFENHSNIWYIKGPSEPFSFVQICYYVYTISYIYLVCTNTLFKNLNSKIQFGFI